MKKINLLLALMLFFHSIIHCQNEDSNSTSMNLEIINAAGGNALASEGSVSYSLGTVFYTTLKTSEAKVSQGAQQAIIEDNTPEETEEEETVSQDDTIPIEEPTEEVEPQENTPQETEEEIVNQDNNTPTEELTEEAEPQENTPQETEEITVIQQNNTPTEEPTEEAEPQENTTQETEEEVTVNQDNNISTEEEEEPQDSISSEDQEIISENADDIFTDEILETSKAKIAIYPNPTVEYTTINIEDFENEFTFYQLFDIQGKQLESNQITNQNTKIIMSHRSNSIYFLRVVILNNLTQTFKIIKN